MTRRPYRTVTGALAIVTLLLTACTGTPAPAESAQPAETAAATTAAATPESASLGVTLDEFIDRWNVGVEGFEELRLGDVAVEDGEFSERITDVIRVTGTVDDKGDVTEAAVIYTGSLESSDDPGYDVLVDGVEQLDATVAWSAFSCAAAAEVDSPECYDILTDIGLPDPGDSLEGVDSELEVAGVRFHFHDAGANGLIYEAIPAE